MNKVNLIGRLTKDPELRKNSADIPYTRFTLAVNRNFLNSNNEREADFISCVAWRKTAEIICNQFKKGSEFALTGRIQTGSYDKEDGTKVTASEVIPTEETKYIVDLAESGYTIKEEADHVHLHFGDLAGDPVGTIKLIKTTAFAPSAYEENWGNPGEIVLEGGYKYAYGGYSTGNCERIELTLKGDGTVALDSFRLQLEGYETIWAKDGVLKLYNADGTVFDYSQALPTGDVKLYIDLKEAGFTTGNACHMHLHFGDLPGATTGKIVISSIKGVSEAPSYKAVMGNYVEYVAPQPAE